MRNSNRPSAKELLENLTAKDKSEAKHKDLFFVPAAKTKQVPTPEFKECATVPVSASPTQPLAVAPPTDEELGISWTDKLKKMLEVHQVILVIADTETKLIPMDDKAFALAAKALQTRPVK